MKSISTISQFDEFFGSPLIYSASIKVTRHCNLKCKHCYVNTDYKKRYLNELTKAEIERIVGELKELGCCQLFVNGGEPLLNNDIFELLKFINRAGYQISMSTNGYVFGKRDLNRLKEIKFHLLQVSIDSPDESHDQIRGRSGSFKRALDFFEFAKTNCNSKNLVIATTLMKHNYKKIFGMYELCAKLKPTTFCVIPIMPSGKATKNDDISVELKKEIFDHLIDEWLMKYQNYFDLSLIIPMGLIPMRFQNTRHGRGYVCSFPHMLGIDSNGNVTPCDGLSDNSEFILGNIRTDSLEKIMSRPSYVKLKNIAETEFEGVCKICKFLSDCQGGCRVEAYNRYGSFTAPDPICQSFYEKGLFPKENLKC